MNEALLGDKAVNPDVVEEERRGCNTRVRFTFVRHSQKETGAVLNAGGDALSADRLSEGGRQRAAEFGRSILAGRSVNKGYATEIERTRETLESAFNAAEIDAPILQLGRPDHGAFFAFPEAIRSPAFLKRYGALMEVHKVEYIEAHYPGRAFKDLSQDEQEKVAEYGNEFAVQMYLDYDNQRPDPDTLAPREEASRVAFKINRLINLPDYMPADSSVDLVSSGHKTSTEAFLSYVIENEETHQVGFRDLKDIGGSLGILDSWDLEIQNNEEGRKTVSIVIQRENGATQRYGINMEALRRLAQEGSESLDITPKKIDSLG